MTSSTTNPRLPKPDKPYPDWSRFLKAVWMHGLSPSNIDPWQVGERIDAASTSIKEALTRRNEATLIRPSAFLACARQTYYAYTGKKAAPMPDNIGPVFAVGHLLHEVSYAAVASALPAGFEVNVEVDVQMPGWWPDDYFNFNQQGRVDMIITAKSAEDFEAYLPIDAPWSMLVDFKTMGGFSYRKHGKTVWGEDPDGFGYLAQLAVYAEATGLIDSGVLIAGINRDALTQPLLPRFITPEQLKEERTRIKLALSMSLDQTDPGEEFLVRHGKEANFYCGRGGKPGYCPFRDVCRDNPTRDNGDE